jgi:16S rRNA (guanine527-N7)-methyltransferase
MPGALKPLGAGFHPSICTVARGLEAPLGDEAVGRIATWFDMIATWNAKVDLTAARTPDELADLMLADALVLARHEAPGNAVVDVGSGAGGPGIALWLSRSDLVVTLVEPREKRVAFLRTVVGQLAPASAGGVSLRVVRARGEDIAKQGMLFDTAVSRATFPPREWLRLGGELVVPGGGVWVLLARESPPVLAGWQIDVDERYRWPLTGAERRAVRYRWAR